MRCSICPALLRKYMVVLLSALVSGTLILLMRATLTPVGSTSIGSVRANHKIDVNAVNNKEQRKSNYHEVTVPRMYQEIQEKQPHIKTKIRPKSSVQWPSAWSRKRVETQSSSQENNNKIPGFACDMHSLSDKVHPPTSNQQSDRRFRMLPERYTNSRKPALPAPTCGGRLIAPWKLSKQIKNSKTPEDIWMVYLVKSAPKYKSNRLAIRQTWGSSESCNGKRITVVFVVGRTDDETVNKELLQESEMYGDILQCNVTDSYSNLPTKVLSAFRWILQENLKSTFYSVTDDDCLIKVPEMQKHFEKVVQNKGHERNLYCGYVYDEDSKPFRTGNKWTLSEKLYSGKRFPTFCHGALWTLSLPLLHAIYCASEVTDYEGFFLEDVLITGILREKLGFENSNIKKTVDKREHDLEELFIFHAGHKSTAETAAEAMKSQWKLWMKP